MHKPWTGGNLWKSVFIKIEIDGFTLLWWFIISLQTESLSFRQRKRVSALSTFDCSVEDYNGCNGYGELGFDSGEAAWETAATSKEGSRRVNYPIPIRGDSDKKYWCRDLRFLLSEWEQFKNLIKELLEGKSGEMRARNRESCVVKSLVNLFRLSVKVDH